MEAVKELDPIEVLERGGRKFAFFWLVRGEIN